MHIMCYDLEVLSTRHLPWAGFALDMAAWAQTNIPTVRVAFTLRHGVGSSLSSPPLDSYTAHAVCPSAYK